MTKKDTVNIRRVLKSDYTSIIALNQSEVQNTSSMDLDRLTLLDSLSVYHRVAVINERITAFIMVMKDHVPYENTNYRWFSSRYDCFLYIDRIVVGKEFQGRKIGSMLYEDLFNFARAMNVDILACEINIIPPNATSLSFHQKHCFREAGRQWLEGGKKQVSMQVASIVTK